MPFLFNDVKVKIILFPKFNNANLNISWVVKHHLVWCTENILYQCLRSLNSPF